MAQAADHRFTYLIASSAWSGRVSASSFELPVSCRSCRVAIPSDAFSCSASKHRDDHIDARWERGTGDRNSTLTGKDSNPGVGDGWQLETETRNRLAWNRDMAGVGDGWQLETETPKLELK
jgi:hypothetical protein